MLMIDANANANAIAPFFHPHPELRNQQKILRIWSKLKMIEEGRRKIFWLNIEKGRYY